MIADIVKSEIKKVQVKAGIQRILGWILALFNGLFVVVGLTQIAEVSDVVMILFFAIPTGLGIWLINLGSRKVKLIKTFYDYSARLAADPQKSIDLLASSMGMTVATVTKKISEMIAYGFFPNTYLDALHNRLVMQNTWQATATPAQDVTRYVIIQCQGCGATNTIGSGTVGECEFCGSKISE